MVLYDKMLPDEIWENILKFVDVLDLIKLKRVSKHWRELITGVIERKCKWYEKCVKDVPEDTWSSILEHHTHPEICCDDFHRSKKYSEIWMSLYRSWIGWSTLAEKSSSTESIVIFNEEKRDFLDFRFIEDDWTFGISCLDAKSSVIAVGTGSEGRVIFYDIANFLGDPIFETHHGFRVAAVCLGRGDGDTIAVANSHDGETKLELWNLRTKSPTVRIIPGGTPLDRWKWISTSFEYCHMVEDHSEDGEDEDPYYVLKLERMGSGIDLRSIDVLVDDLTSGREIVTVSVDGTRMISMVGSPDRHTSYSLYTSDSNNEMRREVAFDSYNLGDTCHFPTFMIFKPRVVAYIDADCGAEFGFLISGDDWKRYNVERDLGLHCTLRCMLYHVGVLIFGCTLGYVLIVDVKNVDGLFNLDLETMRNRLIQLDVTHKLIKTVKVTEYNSHQYLVAATDEKVYLVQFD